MRHQPNIVAALKRSFFQSCLKKIRFSQVKIATILLPAGRYFTLQFHTFRVMSQVSTHSIYDIYSQSSTGKCF